MSCNQLLKASILLNRISDDKRMIILDSSCLSSIEAPRNLSNDSFRIPQCEISKPDLQHWM